MVLSLFAVFFLLPWRCDTDVGCVSKCPSDGDAIRELRALAGCAQPGISHLPLLGARDTMTAVTVTLSRSVMER